MLRLREGVLHERPADGAPGQPPPWRQGSQEARVPRLRGSLRQAAGPRRAPPQAHGGEAAPLPALPEEVQVDQAPQGTRRHPLARKTFSVRPFGKLFAGFPAFYFFLSMFRCTSCFKTFRSSSALKQHGKTKTCGRLQSKFSSAQGPDTSLYQGPPLKVTDEESSLLVLDLRSQIKHGGNMSEDKESNTGQVSLNVLENDM